MDKLKINKANGITLIALVVTIIVLLLLAGISIQMLTGDNGILNRAGQAKTMTDEAQVLENIKLAYNNAQIGKYTNSNENFANKIQEELEKTYGAGNATVTDNGDGTLTVTVNGKIYDIDGDGNVTKQGASIVVGEVTFKDSNGDVITSKIQGEGTVFVHFTASLTGGSISSVTASGLTPSLTNGEWVTEVTANGTYEFTITGTADGETKTTKKTVTVNQFSSIPSGLKIGSTVTYKPSGTSTWEAELCSSTKTPVNDDVTLQTVASGFVTSGNTNMSITNWKVLSIDEDNAKVELISTAPSPGIVYLGQAQGYNNAVYLLNKACNELYGRTITKGGAQYTIEGRNLNIDDIEKRMTDTALATAHTYGSTATWGNTTNAYTSSNYYPTIYAQEVDSKINGNALTGTLNLWTKQTTPIHRNDGVSELQSDGTTTTSKTTTDGKVKATASIQPKQTFWYKDNTFMQTAFKATEEEKENGINDGSNQTANYNLLMTNGSGSTATYWLASRWVDLDSSSCLFCVGMVYGGDVAGQYTCKSDGGTGFVSRALRPVVSLSSKLISGTSSTGFTVEQN